MVIPRPIPRQPPVTMTAWPDMSSGSVMTAKLVRCAQPDSQSDRLVMGIAHTVTDGVAEVVMDNPPVNALTVAGWFELADVVRALGADPAVRVVILTAEGRGFNAGVDIKEMQATEGYTALIGANRGCFAAFAAV